HRALFAGFIDTRDQFFAIKCFIAPVPLQNPEIVALNFLVGGEPMFARKTLPPPTDDRLIFNGARIDHLIITSLTFWATHLPVVVWRLSLSQPMVASRSLRCFARIQAQAERCHARFGESMTLIKALSV